MKGRNALYLALLAGASLLTACSDTNRDDEIQPRTLTTKETVSSTNGSGVNADAGTGGVVKFKPIKPDEDRDGVPDQKDKCPSTPVGVAVDKAGCPFDSDSDGVPDYQDLCPNEVGTAALEGCPDSDGDGVSDYYDHCPNTPATTPVDSYGCPFIP